MSFDGASDGSLRIGELVVFVHVTRQFEGPRTNRDRSESTPQDARTRAGTPADRARLHLQEDSAGGVHVFSMHCANGMQ